MASKIVHRGVAIVTLDDGEPILEHCKAGDIAIRMDASGWWTCFVGDDGEVESYDEAFPSLNHAIWAAKAAAEYGV
jgi:hypothetical protein